MKRVVIFSLPVLVMTFQNCGPNPQFGAVIPEAMTQNGIKEPGLLKTAKVAIIGSQAQAEVDIVWVVDNSGSMVQEAAHVRKNVDAFAARVGQKANLRMAMISRKGNSGTNVSLPNGPEFLHIDQTVGSRDGLLLAASAICDSGAHASPACHTIQGSAANKIRGSLKSFLSRKNAKKVFVFVTDDDSSWNSNNFLAVSKENLEGVPMISSFVRLSAAASPCGMRDGAAYMDLAKKTGGSVFNICNADWSSTFEHLANDVERVINHVVSLPSEVSAHKVVAVMRGNKPVSPTLYQVVGSSLHLSQSLNLTDGEIMQIVYQAHE